MIPRLFLIAIHWLLIAVPCATATSPSQGTIEQPVNLGAHANPHAIPLGPAAWESNYNYGVHALITASRPSQHGAMEWKQGSTLQQNLAYAFGISIDLNQGLTLTEKTVTLRLNNWAKPAYSPYSKEQVLAATLHCMLKNAHATRSNPMQVEIDARNAKDLVWSKKYAGTYISKAETDEKKFSPTPVPGSSLQTDSYGVTHVMFTHKQTAPITHPRPVLIPFLAEGENEPGNYQLLPIWTGSHFKEPLDAIGRPYYLFYDLFNPSQSTPSINALFSYPPQQLDWSIHRDPKGIHAIISYGELEAPTLAATIYALIFSVQPTQEKPLTVTLRPQTEQTKAKVALAIFLQSPGWEASRYGSEQFGWYVAAKCSFVLDSSRRKLTQGSVPLLKVDPDHRRGIRLTP